MPVNRYFYFSLDRVVMDEFIHQFHTCGIVAQMDLPDFKVGNQLIGKAEYLRLFKEASKYSDIQGKRHTNRVKHQRWVSKVLCTFHGQDEKKLCTEKKSKYCCFCLSKISY